MKYVWRITYIDPDSIRGSCAPRVFVIAADVNAALFEFHSAAHKRNTKTLEVENCSREMEIYE